MLRCVILLLALQSSFASADSFISLDQFLQKVSNQNSSLKAIRSKESAAETESGQAQLLTSTEAFAEATHAVDKSPILTPTFNGTERAQDEYKLGLRRQWGFGLKSEAYLVQDRQSIDGALGMMDPSLEIQRQGLRFGLEMPFLKNGLGRETQMRQTALNAASAGDRAMASFERTMQMVEAQKLYIRLAQAQESLKVQVELVAQGRKLVDWVQRQVRDRLLEPVHLALAQVAFEARKLGQTQKELEVRSLTQQLNSFMESDESFAIISTQRLNQLESVIASPTRLSARGDLQAREQYLLAEKSQLSLSREAIRPDLTLKAQYALYRKLADDDDTVRCQPPADCSTLAVSLQFSMPLGGDGKGQLDRGLGARAQAKEAEVQRSRMDSKRDAEVIQSQIQGLSEQGRILLRLIEARQQRLNFERERQGRGRASTFDLIQAEQELFEAKDQLIHVQGGRLELISQLKMYEAKP